MILSMLLYIILSIFGGTIWSLNKFKKRNDESETQNAIVLLIFVELLPLFILIFIVINSGLKDHRWLAPTLSLWALIIWSIIIIICIGFVLIFKKNLIKNYLSAYGLNLFSYSLVTAIILFFIFLIITGFLYSLIEGFEIIGFANFVGLAGIITTLLGILVTLLQFLNTK
ncbi:hypothetical protein QMA04_00200 [Planococcus sp. APC 3900]|uniref:hypothetical protein n=1 Tax=Planococcus sp. APC 3900 TaxID=3035191 RepID=UPI0025B3EC25|nr:hypothetical protein [Planococcus sp. APC 3900]MDN3436485.1 hypothetical protein [Planococcus sp. APC 3900]